MPSFFETITDAIRDFEQHGFDGMQRLEFWMQKIRDAAIASLVPESVLDESLRKTFSSIYRTQIEQGLIIKHHKGVSRFTIDRLKPKLRTELDRRMLISRNLIKINREAMIEKTAQRFSGWASSVPAGGSRAIEVKPVKDNIRKALASLPFEERRVHIDQGTKFLSALNDIIATDGGALAGKWHSEFRRPGYNFRPDHKARDGKIYAIRDNWALQKGLMKAGPSGYTDQITKPGEEVYCSCDYVYLYSLRDLPSEMITKKGEEALADAREKIKAM